MMQSTPAAGFGASVPAVTNNNGSSPRFEVATWPPRAGRPERGASAASSDEEASEKHVEWDWFHNSPHGDVILESNQGVRFRTSSYFLIKASTTFAGMFTIPSSTLVAAPDSNSRPIAIEPIVLDYPTETIRLFLDMISSSDPHVPSLSFDQCRTLLLLADRFDCESLQPRIKAHLLTSPGNSLFEVLVLASDTVDFEMAHQVLQKMVSVNDTDKQLKDNELFWINMDRLRPDWQLMLFRGLVQRVNVTHYHGDYRISRVWSNAAPIFEAAAKKRKRDEGGQW